MKPTNYFCDSECFIPKASSYVLVLMICSFMEGARLQSSVALPREATKETTVEDNGETITIKKGEEIVCNLVSNCPPLPL